MKNTLKSKYTKIALALSLCVLIMWAVLGTGTSLAWFTDKTHDRRNVFNIGDIDLTVSYKPYNSNADYILMDDTTNIFDDDALYEPGYVQVLYLKIKNTGDIPFDFKTAVSVADFTPGTNVFLQSFNLQDHLRFGVIFADNAIDRANEDILDNLVKDRLTAKSEADLKFKEKTLNSYSSETLSLDVGEEAYMALVVRMPEDVGNIANYRNDNQPSVKLGLIVKATQHGSPIE